MVQLLQALDRPLNRGNKAKIVTFQFTVKGWNTRDKLDSTSRSAGYANVLTNIRPREGRGKIRAGWDDHATGLPSSDVQSLLHYTSGSSEKLFAAVGTEIYEVTSAGAVGAAAVSSLTNAKWQQTMHATAGNNYYLIIVNGADGVRSYDGTSWATQTITGSADETTFIDVLAHKFRLWFIEANTLSTWYLGTYAISGAATEFDYSAIFKHGGSLLKLATWTLDAGDGMDDMFVAITTEGEIAVYAGTDPGSASTWVLQGVYKIDRPIGRRCVVKYGGDLAILTVSGVVMMSQVLAGLAAEDQFSDPIRDEFVDNAVSNEATYGWELVLYSKYAELMVNMPAGSGTYQQFNNVTLSNAWWLQVGINAICWSEFNGGLYFGGPSGVMGQADTDTSDNGTNIEVDYEPAWSRCGTPLQKQATMMRPIIFADGAISLQGDIKADYDESGATSGVTTVTAEEGAAWDAEQWDSTDAIWGGGVTQRGRWASADAEGLVLSPRLRIATATATVEIGPVDVAFTEGGIA